MKKMVLLGVFATLCISSIAMGAKIVQVKGSDTIVNASQHIAEKYMNENKKARIAVTGGGSGVGISSLINRTADIGMASRSIKEKEMQISKKKGLDITEVVLGFDGITLIVNKDNKIGELSSAQLTKIFKGDITNWKEIGGDDAKIVVLSRDSSSGTHEFFKEHIVREGNTNKSAEYGQNILYMPSNNSIKQEIENNKYAIGYIGMGYVDNTVKSLKVDSILPTVANVSSKKYPIAREIYWYVLKSDNKDVQKLVEFALSPKGQKIIADEGFVPVK